jgi:hypothetical protein
METVFRAECLQIFPVTSGSFPMRNSRKSLEKFEDIPPGILLDPVAFSHLYGKIRLFPEAGIIDLGSFRFQ